MIIVGFHIAILILLYMNMERHSISCFLFNVFCVLKFSLYQIQCIPIKSLKQLITVLDRTLLTFIWKSKMVCYLHFPLLWKDTWPKQICYKGQHLIGTDRHVLKFSPLSSLRVEQSTRWRHWRNCEKEGCLLHANRWRLSSI